MTQKTQGNWRNTIAAGAVGLASLTSTGYAQSEAPKVEVKPTLNFDLNEAYTSGGFYSQNSFSSKFGKDNGNTLAGMLETISNGDTNVGLELRTPDFRLNGRYGFRSDEDGGNVAGMSATWYPTKGSFVGASFNSISGDDRFIAYDGMDLTDKLHVQGTFDNEGNVRAVVFPKIFENATLGLSAARTAADTYEGEISFNTDKVWADVKFGDRPLDARLVIGNIDPNFTKYVVPVTEQGNNELDVFPDQIVKFDIADGFFDYYGVGYFLGKEAGDWAIDTRYKEDSKVSTNVAYRIGDVGVLNDLFVSGGPYYDIANERVGASVMTGFNISDNPNANFRFRVDANEEDVSAGVLFNLRF